MKKILIVNGPNLNKTGKREPIYGTRTLDDINKDLAAWAKEQGAELRFFQSNSEGALIDALHNTDADGVVLNAGAYTHYSYALADAIRCTSAPVVEVHMTNVAAREEFRHTSVIAPACIGTIAGFGEDSYRFGVAALLARLK